MKTRVVLLALVAGLATVAAGVLPGVAAADYGTGTQYQVEISANNVDGGNFWYWAALGPGPESDYQNTDCIHTSSFLGPNGTEGSAHTSGSLTRWSDSNGMIEMDGVSIVGGLATANFFVSDAPHSSWFGMIVTSEKAPIFPQFVIDHQIMLTWQGSGTQVQVAP